MKALLALLDVVPSWVWAALLAVCLATGVAQQLRIAGLKVDVAHQKAQTAAEQGAHAQTRAQYATALAQAQAEARGQEQKLRESMDSLQRSKDREIAKLGADVRDLRGRLSDLPTRPAGSPGAATAAFDPPAQGSDGPILYRDTAQALADEAGRADRIRIELMACYDAWDKAREILKEAK